MADPGSSTATISLTAAANPLAYGIADYEPLIGRLRQDAALGLALLLATLVKHSGLSWTPPGRINRVPLSVQIWGQNRLLLASAIALTLVAALSA